MTKTELLKFTEDMMSNADNNIKKAAGQVGGAYWHGFKEAATQIHNRMKVMTQDTTDEIIGSGDPISIVEAQNNG